MTGTQAPPRNRWAELAPLAALLVASLLIKGGLIAYLGGRVYGDVIRSVNFGLGLEEGLIAVTTHVDNTRSFLGPVLNAALYHAGGVAAIKFANMVAFTGLAFTMYGIGRNRYDARVVTVAVALLALYAGGHRNVVAGELEDNLASLIFAAGLFVHLRSRRVVAAGLLMGIAFLVKFWILVFIGAFGLVLVLRRRWRDAALLAMAGLVPVLLISLVDEGATVQSLLMSAERQQGYSSWSTVAFRMVSTGLLPTVLVSAWTALKRPSEHGTLFFAMIAGYFAYVLLFRDAHAVSFVMMLCLVTAGFLVAVFLVHSPLVGAARAHGRARLAVVLVVFAVGNLGIAWQNLYRDTHPFSVTPGQGAKRIAPAVAPQVQGVPSAS